MQNTLAYIFARAARRIATAIELRMYNVEMNRRIAEPARSMGRAEALERSKFILVTSRKVNNIRFGNNSYAKWYQQVEAVKARRNGIAAQAELYQRQGKYQPAAQLAA
jgi:hypothetical protein